MGNTCAKGRRCKQLLSHSVLALLAVGLSIFWPNAGSFAQSAGGLSSVLSQISPDQLQQLLQSNPGLAQNLNGQTTLPPAVTPQVQTLSPPSSLTTEHEAQEARVNEASDIEALMSTRAKTTLKLFGYDQMGVGNTVTQAQVGAVQGSYILGPGDQLDVSLRGQENSEFIVTVDRDGRILLPKLQPIFAAGRSLDDVRQALQQAIQKAYISTQGFVTIAQLRQINVLVVGQVNNPGQQTLTGLSTILDALNLAGGIKKAGSLRDVIIIRGVRAFRLDLYAILMTHRTAPNLTLAQGDRIVVPSIGPTIALAGDVRRPGIYELSPGTTGISEREAEAFGNGVLIRGAYRDMVLRIRPDGKEDLVDTTSEPGTIVRDGEILFVKQAVKITLGEVTLTGSVRLPGLYALDRAKTIHDLLPNMDVFAPTPYMLLGLVQRTDPHTLQKMLLPFSPLHVVEGKENISLLNDDKVLIFNFDEMRQFAQSLAAPTSQTPPNPEPSGANTASQGGQQTSVQGQNSAVAQNSVLSNLGVPVQPGATGNAGAVSPGLGANGTGAASFSTGQPASNSNLGLPQSADTGIGGPGGTAGVSNVGSTSALAELSATDLGYLGSVLQDDHIYLEGAVRLPGDFLAAPGTTLGDVLSAAGGLTSDADTSAFEVTSTYIDNASGLSTTKRETSYIPPTQYGSLILRPLDAINFHHVYTDRTAGTVRITGQVRYPGEYTLLRGERLSQVLVRAGGLTNIAYPYGTVFLRDTLKRIEEEAHDRLAQELQDQLVTGLARAPGQANSSGTGAQIGSGMLSEIQQFIQQYRNQPAVGRFNIIADPSVLAANPQQDPMMEAGDSVFIPERPSTVTVVGDVMQPGNFPFDQRADSNRYIAEAGGLADSADTDHIFVVFPDGTAHQLDRSWTNFSPDTIPPGSVIYVPRNILPTNWYALAATLATIFQGLAVSAASLAVISHN